MALIPQWTEDLVAIPPAGPILRGRAAYVAVVEQIRDQMKGVEVVENVVDFEEVKVLGDYAYEWGTYRGRMRPSGGGETVAYGGNLMRILQRHPDGTWKMHRAIWTNDPPSPKLQRSSKIIGRPVIVSRTTLIGTPDRSTLGD